MLPVVGRADGPARADLSRNTWISRGLYHSITRLDHRLLNSLCPGSAALATASREAWKVRGGGRSACKGSHSDNVVTK